MFVKALVRQLILVRFAAFLFVAPAASPVSSGDLGQIVLDVFPDQVVGQPLLITARTVLLDDSGRVLTDYNLAADPIHLVPASGQLAPDILDNPALFEQGIVDFLPVQVRYLGRTGAVGITALGDTIASTPVMVTFNGYDILEASDLAGNDIETIYSGLVTTIRVVVQNSGSLVADESPTLKSYFRSGGGSVKSFLTPHADGQIDTVVVDLPTDNLTGGDDSLVLMLESHYRIHDSSYVALDSLIVPMTVLIPQMLGFVNGSFRPDSVYAGEEFDISFRVAANGFVGPIDSSCVVVRLYADTGQSALTTVYDGVADTDGPVDDTLTYTVPAALIDTAAGLSPGCYTIRLDYYLVSGGDVYALDIRYPDSVCIVAPASLSYVNGSLLPLKVPVGRETCLTFDLLLDGTRLLEVEPSRTDFTVSGDGFSTTVGLSVPSGRLEPGVNSLRSDSIFIPIHQLGKHLTVSASLQYRHSGVANWLTFATDFEGLTVLAEDLPLAQITEVWAVSPNSPRVNTLQPFRIGCTVANLSSVPVEPFVLRLSSGGASVFEPNVPVDSIAALETAEVFFDVVAAGEPAPQEVFRVDFASADPDRLPPVDSTEAILIERPANLRLTRSMPGTEAGIVGIGAGFSMVVEITNDGDAEVSAAVFRLTSHGVDLGISDPLLGTIEVGDPLSILLVAPGFDTTVVLDFELIDRPVDLNDTLPAEIDDTAFEVMVSVVSLEADLLVESEIVTSNLVLPGADKDLFSLTLTNRGTSALCVIKVEEITLSFAGPEGEPVNPGSILAPGSGGFFEDGIKLSAATIEQHRMTLAFENLLLGAGDRRRLVFRAAVPGDASGEFQIRLADSGVTAVFGSGPHAGQSVAVKSATGDASIIAESYTPTQSLTAEGSFVIKQNPFNPLESEAEFQFYLPEPSQVEFRIFTLVGEGVFSRVYAEGALAPVGGDPLVTLTWSGCNDAGHAVLNGVYIAVIRIAKSGDEARLKVAVVK